MRVLYSHIENFGLRRLPAGPQTSFGARDAPNYDRDGGVMWGLEKQIPLRGM